MKAAIKMFSTQHCLRMKHRRSRKNGSTFVVVSELETLRNDQDQHRDSHQFKLDSSIRIGPRPTHINSRSMNFRQSSCANVHRIRIHLECDFYGIQLMTAMSMPMPMPMWMNKTSRGSCILIGWFRWRSCGHGHGHGYARGYGHGHGHG